MVAVNNDPEAGGNTVQPDDGRDEHGRLPEPLDAAHYGADNPDVEIIQPPGMPPSQPAGTGPVVSTPLDDDGDALDDSAAAHRDDSAAAQGGPHVEHDVSGTPVVEGAESAPSAPDDGPGNASRTSGTVRAQPAKKTAAAPAKTTGAKTTAEAKAENAKADNTGDGK